ncbi:MAG: hypothetical protein E7465_07840 [Ruminococcaceae bacterium]|nr:hypothetical protein [Oscillospiraceae bacterium]
MNLYHSMLTQITAPTVPQSGAHLMPEQTDNFGAGLFRIVQEAIGSIRPDLKEAAAISMSLIALMMLISLIRLIPGSNTKLPDFICAVGIGTVLLQSTNSLITLGVTTIQDLSSYAKLLLPVMTSALAAQGGITTSTALYAGTAIFNSILSSLLSKLMVPMLYIYLVLATAHGALGEEILKKMAEFIKWLSVWILKGVLYLFTGYMGITGVLSGTTDAAALKAAKLTISGVVPVVGGILSDASEAVLVGAGLVRNAAGVYGILAMLAVFAGPFLRIGCHYLMIRITGAVCSVFGSKQCTQLISDYSGAMGLLLAMTGTMCLLGLISTVCFLKGVG